MQTRGLWVAARDKGAQTVLDGAHSCNRAASSCPKHQRCQSMGLGALQRGCAIAQGVAERWGGCRCSLQRQARTAMPWNTRPMKIWEMWKAQASTTAATMKRMPEYSITRVCP